MITGDGKGVNNKQMWFDAVMDIAHLWLPIENEWGRF